MLLAVLADRLDRLTPKPPVNYYGIHVNHFRLAARLVRRQGRMLMRYYPICLRIEGRRCLVVGGGAVAARKARGLIEAGAEVVVVSPELGAGLQRLHGEGRVSWVARGYQEGDSQGFFLVMAATDDPTVQGLVRADASRHRSLLNVADVPERCDFILPAVVQRGSLSLAISTSGKSPALAKRLQDELGQWLGPEYALLNEVMGLIRPHVRRRGWSQPENERLFKGLIEGGILEIIVRADGPGLIDYLERGLGQTLPGDLAGQLQGLLAAGSESPIVKGR